MHRQFFKLRLIPSNYINIIRLNKLCKNNSLNSDKFEIYKNRFLITLHYQCLQVVTAERTTIK